MKYSDDDVRELCLDIDRIVSGDKVANIGDLQKVSKKEAGSKDTDFQSKCELDSSLGNLL